MAGGQSTSAQVIWVIDFIMCLVINRFTFVELAHIHEQYMGMSITVLR